MGSVEAEYIVGETPVIACCWKKPRLGKNGPRSEAEDSLWPPTVFSSANNSLFNFRLSL
jgi:hypothetical protein